MENRAIVYHGSPHLDLILDSDVLLSKNAQAGRNELHCLRKQSSLLAKMADLTRSYIDTFHKEAILTNDEDYAFFAHTHVAPLALFNYISGNDINRDWSIEDLQKDEDYLKIKKIYAHVSHTIDSNYVMLSYQKSTSEFYLVKRGKDRKSDLRGVLELSIAKDRIKDNFTHYPVVWWELPITDDCLNAVYPYRLNDNGKVKLRELGFINL